LFRAILSRVYSSDAQKANKTEEIDERKYSNVPHLLSLQQCEADEHLRSAMASSRVIASSGCAWTQPDLQGARLSSWPPVHRWACKQQHTTTTLNRATDDRTRCGLAAGPAGRTLTLTYTKAVPKALAAHRVGRRLFSGTLKCCARLWWQHSRAPATTVTSHRPNICDNRAILQPMPLAVHRALRRELRTRINPHRAGACGNAIRVKLLLAGRRCWRLTCLGDSGARSCTKS
jgi:hypothetical protein